MHQEASGALVDCMADAWQIAGRAFPDASGGTGHPEPFWKFPTSDIRQRIELNNAVSFYNILAERKASDEGICARTKVLEKVRT